MENRIYGIITIIAALAIYTYAFKNYRKNKYNYSLYLLILGGLILRIYTSFDFYLHDWDERFHALVAKNLIDNPFKPMLYSTPLLEYDYKNWAANHVWLHKQPVPLYTMALSMFLFGKNIFALRLPSIILSTITIASTFKIGEILQSKKVGLLAAFLFSINGLIIEQTAGRVATDHIDVFFVSLTSFAILFLLKNTKNNSKKYLVLGSFFTGLAILTKWLPALIVVPIWILYSHNKIGVKNIVLNLLLFTVIVLGLVLPWQYYILSNFPNEATWEYAYNKMHIFEALGPHGKPSYYHFDKMRTIFGELIYLPLIWLLFTSVKGKINDNISKKIISIWILLPYLFFSYATTKMQGYILICAPAIFIMTSMFYHEIKEHKTKYIKIKNLFLALLIILPVRYSIERIKPFSIRDRHPNWITKIKNIQQNSTNEKLVLFNCKYPIKTMFHTNIIAYETIPEIDILNKLNTLDYDVYIDNNKPIMREWMNLKYVSYIQITGD